MAFSLTLPCSTQCHLEDCYRPVARSLVERETVRSPDGMRVTPSLRQHCTPLKTSPTRKLAFDGLKLGGFFAAAGRPDQLFQAMAVGAAEGAAAGCHSLNS